MFQWTVICSQCESFIILKSSQSLPKECPHCNVVFEPEKTLLKADEKDHTFVPAIDEYMQKIKNL